MSSIKPSYVFNVNLKSISTALSNILGILLVQISILSMILMNGIINNWFEILFHYWGRGEVGNKAYVRLRGGVLICVRCATRGEGGQFLTKFLRTYFVDDASIKYLDQKLIICSYNGCSRFCKYQISIARWIGMNK